MPTQPILSHAAILRLLRGLLAAELAAGGRRISQAEAANWPDGLVLDDAGLGLDSLQRLACGAAVNEMFHLHESGIEDLLLAETRLDGWAAIVRRGLQSWSTSLSFRTSGSTGLPRVCEHPMATLRAETLHWAKVFADRRRVVQMVPAHHIYGCLFTVLLPEAMGLPVLDARGLSPASLRQALRRDDLLVGFPTALRLLPRLLPALPSGLRITSSTAPLPAEAARALLALGAAEVTEIYGSSETAGVAARTTPGAGFALLQRWQPGQEGDAASVIEAATGRAYPLPDRVAWTGDRLVLGGRKDAAVQVGGINVFPGLVAEQLRRHPQVADCAMRLDASLPEPRLKAFVIPRPGITTETLAALLERWCREVLSDAERPVRLDFGASLPVGAMGKPSDWAVT